MVQLFLYVAYGAAGLCLLLQSVYMCGRLTCAGGYERVHVREAMSELHSSLGVEE